MGAMRMNNKHLSDTIQVCRYVIENTEKLISTNWIRTGLWTTRTIILIYTMLSHFGETS